MSLYLSCLIYRVVTSLCDCGHVSLCVRHVLRINKSVKPWKESMSKQSILIKRNATSCMFFFPQNLMFLCSFFWSLACQFFHYLHNFTPFFSTYLRVLWLFFLPFYNFWRDSVRDFSNVFFKSFCHFQNLKPFFPPFSNFQSIFFSNHYYYVHFFRLFFILWDALFWSFYLHAHTFSFLFSFLDIVFSPKFFFHFHAPKIFF